MAQPLVDTGLQDPKSVVGKDGVIFGELLGWGARLAIGTLILFFLAPPSPLSLLISRREQRYTMTAGATGSRRRFKTERVFWTMRC